MYRKYKHIRGNSRRSLCGLLLKPEQKTVPPIFWDRARCEVCKSIIKQRKTGKATVFNAFYEL